MNILPSHTAVSNSWESKACFGFIYFFHLQVALWQIEFDFLQFGATHLVKHIVILREFQHKGRENNQTLRSNCKKCILMAKNIKRPHVHFQGNIKDVNKKTKKNNNPQNILTDQISWFALNCEKSNSKQYNQKSKVMMRFQMKAHNPN